MLEFWSLDRHSITDDHIRAISWQNQQNGICAQQRLRSAWTSAQSDQSLHCPHEDWVLSYPLSAQRRLRSAWASAQADLSLHWAHGHMLVLSWGVAHFRTIHYSTMVSIMKDTENLKSIWEPFTSQWHSFLQFFRPKALIMNTVIYSNKWSGGGGGALQFTSPKNDLLEAKCWQNLYTKIVMS